jgi:sulfur-oxidizing protein SoxZ
MRIKQDGNAAEVLVLVNHPMETGLRVDKKTKEKIPAHWIQKMTFTLNGKTVAEVDMGVAVSADPLTGIRIEGVKPGDKVQVSWSDNKGETGSAEATI